MRDEEYSKVAKEFDDFYKEEKAVLRRAIDKIFRKSMIEGRTLTLKECRNANGKKILDIGCGSGQLSVELAKRGAHVVSIDSSSKIIEMAKLMAERGRLRSKLTIIHDDFATHVFNDKFNLSLALGVFDYTKDAAFYIKKMKSLTTEKCIMSFPSKFAFQVPLKMIWLRSRSLPAYFYTKSELKRLLSEHFPHYKIKSISARYFCVASIYKPQSARVTGN